MCTGVTVLSSILSVPVLSPKPVRKIKVSLFAHVWFYITNRFLIFFCHDACVFCMFSRVHSGYSPNFKCNLARFFLSVPSPQNILDSWVNCPHDTVSYNNIDGRFSEGSRNAAQRRNSRIWRLKPLEKKTSINPRDLSTNMIESANPPILDHVYANSDHPNKSVDLWGLCIAFTQPMHNILNMVQPCSSCYVFVQPFLLTFIHILFPRFSWSLFEISQFFENIPACYGILVHVLKHAFLPGEQQYPAKPCRKSWWEDCTSAWN